MKTHRKQSFFSFLDERASSPRRLVGTGLEDEAAACVVHAGGAPLGGVGRAGLGQRLLRAAVVAVPAAVVRRQPERRRRPHAIPVPQSTHPLSLVCSCNQRRNFGKKMKKLIGDNVYLNN